MENTGKEDKDMVFEETTSTELAGKRIGVAKGKFEVPEDFDDWDMGFGSAEG